MCAWEIFTSMRVPHTYYFLSNEPKRKANPHELQHGELIITPKMSGITYSRRPNF
jgi:hypothetical protein